MRIQKRRRHALLAGIVAASALAANQAAYIPQHAPEMVYIEGGSPTVVVSEGLLGYPERLEDVRRLGAFDDHSLLMADPRGDRYSLEVAAQAAYRELKDRDIQRLTPMGLSMGAKQVWRLLQLIEEDEEYNPTIELVVLIDPLYDGHGVKHSLAGPIRTSQWRPGWASNALDELAGRFMAQQFIQTADNPHQLRGRQASLRWIVSQVREAAGPAVPGELNMPPRVAVLRCAKDDTLHRQGWPWLKRYGSGHIITVPNTTHVSLDNPDHAEAWARAIQSALV